MANDTITAVKGFLAAGVKSGVKKSGASDLGLICCPGGAVAAAVFTTNKVVSASVSVCKEHIKSGKVYGAVVNSGNANTCTGKAGLADAVAMCARAGKELGVSPHSILVASTGIIGRKLAIGKITAGIGKAAGKLSASAKAGGDFARAIMTTDTRAKQAARRIEVSGREVTIAGTVKGAGMIGPNMATTICVILTDAAITKALLGRALKGAIGESLNKLTVDGHQSTNDTAMILASGAAGNRLIVSQCPRYKRFAKALCELCTDLVKQMALDAEGASRMFTVVVKGAANEQEAAKAARAVADYDLVKCAVHGGDPNWGRIICAVGSCGVRVNPEKLSCRIGGVSVFSKGGPVKFNPQTVSRIISQKEHTISVDLGVGKASDFCYGCDLSRGYIRINADYHT